MSPAIPGGAARPDCPPRSSAGTSRPPVGGTNWRILPRAPTDISVLRGSGGPHTALTSPRAPRRSVADLPGGGPGAGEGDSITDISPELDSWMRTLHNTVGMLLGHGSIPEGFTWSGVANPFIWAASFPPGRRRLRATLDQLAVGHRSADMVSDWWGGHGIRTASAAADWITAHSGPGLVPGPRVAPYGYISAALQEHILAEAGASWLIQIEMLRADASQAMDTLIPSSGDEFSSEDEHNNDPVRKRLWAERRVRGRCASDTLGRGP